MKVRQIRAFSVVEKTSIRSGLSGGDGTFTVVLDPGPGSARGYFGGRSYRLGNGRERALRLRWVDWPRLRCIDLRRLKVGSILLSMESCREDQNGR